MSSTFCCSISAIRVMSAARGILQPMEEEECDGPSSSGRPRSSVPKRRLRLRRQRSRRTTPSASAAPKSAA
eukprot:scaffold42301_cov27-Tisochrysis_lutea.AAC.6